VIYLYAITEPTVSAPACRGLDDGELRLARTAQVAGLYTEHRRLEPRADADTLWRHEQVVEEAMKAGPALPVRFGTTFADDAALGLELERDGDRLRQQLDGVRGCVELAVRVGVAGGRHDAAADGREYVEAKLARRRMQQAIAHDTLAPLAELAVRTRTEEGGTEGEVICASYLVPSDGVELFADQVSSLADRNPGLWLSCTGPWPPYSFVELEVAA
jgi:gas vesicle protein GvpL/GvpF